jgi:hypothetical protein
MAKTNVGQFIGKKIEWKVVEGHEFAHAKHKMLSFS